MEKILSLEARLVLVGILDNQVVLEDIASQVQEMDAAQLLEVVREASERLRRLETGSLGAGGSETCVLGTDCLDCGSLRTGTSGTPDVSVRVSSDYRVFVNRYSEREILLPPLTKALLILFLRHPDGVDFPKFHTYRDELAEIYARLSPRLDMTGIQRSIDLLLDRRSNSFHQHKSRLNCAISEYTRLDLLPKVEVLWE